uniref:Uncharacterized protein n=1 Tax=Physcomitrium patens TaxID=3218 RepID=A0A2K1IGN5_PHYPA|nr:hypothetical protein PHYPA_029033 [Physcomitrium patens]
MRSSPVRVQNTLSCIARGPTLRVRCHRRAAMTTTSDQQQRHQIQHRYEPQVRTTSRSSNRSCSTTDKNSSLETLTGWGHNSNHGMWASRLCTECGGWFSHGSSTSPCSHLSPTHKSKCDASFPPAPPKSDFSDRGPAYETHHIQAHGATHPIVQHTVIPYSKHMSKTRSMVSLSLLLSVSYFRQAAWSDSLILFFLRKPSSCRRPAALGAVES